jgi:LemA protein
MDAFGFTLVAIIVAAILYTITAYNRLVRLKHNVKAAWSNIDVLLKQRHDELPKLVTTCSEYMKYEQETLERVTAARSRVASALQSGNMNELVAGESMLHGGLGQLFALAENYPELKSNESFRQLQMRISSLENAIADRREFYNDSVNINNIAVEAFPTNIIAGQFKFVAAPLFEVDAAETQDVDMKALFA